MDCIPDGIGIDTTPLPSRRIKDLRGQVFGRLTVVAYEGRSEHGAATWRCVCSCPRGKIVTVVGNSLARRKVTSCGCRMREVAAERAAGLKRSHGLTSHPLYPRWRGMLDRCYNPACGNYARYGGRGITVHSEWRDNPAAFIAYVERLPGCGEPSMQLDRIDNDGPYAPGQVQWITGTANQRKKSNNRPIAAFGQTRCLAEWAELLGLRADTVSRRLGRSGWPAERALSEGADPAALAVLGYGEPEQLAFDADAV